MSASPLANESSPPSSAAKSAIATPRVLASSSAADAEALRASDPAMEAERSRHEAERTAVAALPAAATRLLRELEAADAAAEATASSLRPTAPGLFYSIHVLMDQ